jgi:hypothetical protein
MNRGSLVRWLLGTAITGAAAGAADAQPIGTYSWQLAPYCNVITVAVTQNGAQYTLDGYDTQCGGGSHRAPVTGIAVPNPNGSIGLGFSIVTSPGGAPVHVSALLELATLGGSWTDSLGNTGAFVFTPAGVASGSPRALPLAAVPDGSISTAKLADAAVTAAKVDASEVQRRVLGACASGTLMTGVNEDGSVACETVTSGAGGDITEVTAGTGLGGGGTTGAVSLRVLFSGTGTMNAAARSDHFHGFGTAFTNTAVGNLAADNTGIGAGNTAVGYQALQSNTIGGQNTAIGAGALRLGGGHNQIAVGYNALTNLATGQGNAAFGHEAGSTLTSGFNNLYLGSPGAASESNTMRLGTSLHIRTFIEGIRGRTTGLNDAQAVVIDSAGQLGTISSSRDTKTDIDDLDAPVGAALHRLRPVQFRYRQAFADGSSPIQYGLIAEEVQEVLPELVALDGDGRPASVKYHVLPALLLAEVQRLERERAEQGDLIRGLRDALAALAARLEETSGGASPR